VLPLASDMCCEADFPVSNWILYLFPAAIPNSELLAVLEYKRHVQAKDIVSVESINVALVFLFELPLFYVPFLRLRTSTSSSVFVLEYHQVPPRITKHNIIPSW
jgi:hypothetical protein